MTLRDNPDIPELPGFISITQAAEDLGVTRQYLFRLADNGGLQTVHRIGRQPMFVVSTEEVERLAGARKQEEVRKDSVDN